MTLPLQFALWELLSNLSEGLRGMGNRVPSMKRLPAAGQMTPQLRLTLWSSLALALIGVFAAVRILSQTRSIYKLPIFFHQFVVHDLPGSLLSAVIILIAMLSYRRNLVPLHAIEYLDRYRYLVAAGLVALLAVGTLTVYHNHPLSVDEFAQLFQARIFAKGRIWAEYPPELLDWLLPFTHGFFRPGWATGQVVSEYWPGLSLLQTPFVLVGIPWLLNPLLGAGTLLLIRRLAAELYPDTNAPAWAMFLTLASPAFIVNCISYYGMPAQLFLNLLFTVFVLRMTPWSAVAAGFVGSVALLQTNPVPHTFYAIPWLVWVVGRRHGWRSMVWLCLGYLPLSVFLGLGWIFVRVHLNEGQAGQAHTVWQWLPALAASTMVTNLPSLLLVRTMGLLKLAAWTVPGLVILSVLGAWKGWADGRTKTLTASALLMFFGYFLFRFSQGHGWGCRYFHGAWGTLPLLACGLVAAKKAGASKEFTPLARAAGTLAVLSFVLLNGLRLYQVDAWMDRHLAQLPELDSGRAQVCFVRPWQGYYSVDLVQNDPFLRQETIFLKSHGRETERPFMEQYFPGAAPRSDAPDEAVWYVEREKVDWWKHCDD
jgi:hypothetical protein